MESCKSSLVISVTGSPFTSNQGLTQYATFYRFKYWHFNAVKLAGPDINRVTVSSKDLVLRCSLFAARTCDKNQLNVVLLLISSGGPRMSLYFFPKSKNSMVPTGACDSHLCCIVFEVSI